MEASHPGKEAVDKRDRMSVPDQAPSSQDTFFDEMSPASCARLPASSVLDGRGVGKKPVDEGRTTQAPYLADKQEAAGKGAASGKQPTSLQQCRC